MEQLNWGDEQCRISEELKKDGRYEISREDERKKIKTKRDNELLDSKITSKIFFFQILNIS